MKTSKVTKASPANRTWSLNGKTFYVHNISFENGDEGEYSSVGEAQDKFVVGQEADYEYIPAKDNFAPKIKPIQQQRSGGAHKGKQVDPKSFAASYAKDIACELIRAGHIKETKDVTSIINHYFEAFLKLIA